MIIKRNNVDCIYEKYAHIHTKSIMCWSENNNNILKFD